MFFFSRVLHNENHVLHPLLPEPNDMDSYELRRRRHERGLKMPDAISFTTMVRSNLLHDCLKTSTPPIDA